MITYYNSWTFQLFCLSTDTKPKLNRKSTNGSLLLEIDTGKRYCYDFAGKRWLELPSSGGGGGGQTVEVLAYGYYDEENDTFWKDATHVTPWPRSNSKLYIDQSTGMIYSLFDNKYNSLIAVASQDKYGVIKLYGGTGQNVDGTVTQKAFTDALNNIASIEEEILEIKSDF